MRRSRLVEFSQSARNRRPSSTLHPRNNIPVIQPEGAYVGGRSDVLAEAEGSTIAATIILAAATAGAQPRRVSAVAAPAAAPRDDGQWTMPAKNYASTRYSALSEINRRNVAALRPVVNVATGNRRGHEAPPLVVGSTMIVVTPYPNTVFGLDLAKAAAPVKWVYRPRPRPAAQGVACCDVVNRGGAYANGRFFFNTLDGATVALVAASGRQLWRTQLGNVGPPLDGIGTRAVVAGRLENKPDNLMRWIMNPQAVAPGTDMPYLGIEPGDARDIAAFLYVQS